MFVVLLVTNHIYDFANPETRRVAPDSYSYISVARAVPHLPAQPQMYNHAQRAAVPYAIGLAGRVLPVRLDLLFQIAALLTLAAAVGIFVLTLNRAGVAAPIVCAVSALIVFNPYLMRLPVAFSALIDQPLFFLGSTVVVLAVVEDRSSLLIAGSIVSAIGRQTAMTFLPALLLLAVWRRRWSPVVSAILIAAIYFGTGMIAATFADPSINVSTITGIFADFGHVSIAVFDSYFRDCAFPLVAALLLLLFLRDVRFAAGKVLHDPRHAVLALLALGILGSPVLMGPTISGGNGARLAALALPPLLILVALLLEEAGHPFVRSPLFAAAVTLCAVIGSFHHLYSSVGFSRRQFVIANLLSWLGIAAFAVGARLSARVRSAAGSEAIGK
jgi:hypothetical protein